MLVWQTIDLEVEKDYRTKIYFSCKNMRMVLYRKTVAVLGYPEYVRLVLNVDEKKLAVQACDFRDPGAIKVPGLTDSVKYHVFASINLIALIWKICEWDEYSTYQITGTAHKGYRLVNFDLRDAVKKIDESDILLL